MNKWRNSCPEKLIRRIEDVAEARLYLLRQTGPTGFLLKEDESNNKFKVLLGGTHSCDCAGYVKEKELCKHILWTLVKKFRLAKDNPLVYQLGLCERELQNVLMGNRKAKPKINEQKSMSADGDRDHLKQKNIDEDDVCPICQESIYRQNKNTLSFCRFGCGNSVHIKCMKIWGDHQLKSSGDDMIKCPLCRTQFAAHRSIVQEYHKLAALKKSIKKMNEISCLKCSSKSSANKSYRCCTCTNIWLCEKCIHTQIHFEHQFEYRKTSKESWKQFNRLHPLLHLSPSIKNFEQQDKMKTRHPNGRGHVIRSAPVLQRQRNESESNFQQLCFGVNGIEVRDGSPPCSTTSLKQSFLPPIHATCGIIVPPTSTKRKMHPPRKKNNIMDRKAKADRKQLYDLGMVFTISSCNKSNGTDQ